MSQFKIAGSWLNSVSGVLRGDRGRRTRPLTRRLSAELLEGRMVLSGAPIDGVDGSESLAEYLAHEQQMGPVAPAELVTYDQELAAYGVDDFLVSELPEGEGCEELPEGCGEGSGSGSGGGDPPPDEPPSASNPTVDTYNGSTSVTATVTDDGGMSGLSANMTAGSGSVSIDENGNLVITNAVPDEYGYITVTITDLGGNTTTLSMQI